MYIMLSNAIYSYRFTAIGVVYVIIKINLSLKLKGA